LIVKAFKNFLVFHRHPSIELRVTKDILTQCQDEPVCLEPVEGPKPDELTFQKSITLICHPSIELRVTKDFFT